jgi:hypothetical protein
MPDATATNIAWWCLTVTVISLAITAAAAAVIIVLWRRVGELAADQAGMTSERPVCPDRVRIDALEDYAAGGNGSHPRGRHGVRPAPPDLRTRRGRPDPDPRGAGLLAAPAGRRR